MLFKALTMKLLYDYNRLLLKTRKVINGKGSQ